MMPLPLNEPTTAQAVQAWVDQHTKAADRFGHIAEKYEPHRSSHGCYDVYPYPNGPLLGALAAISRPRRLLEVGCGLGYSALWLVHGAGAGATLDSIELNDDHARIATEHFHSEGLADRVKILNGRASSVLTTLNDTYDLIYFDTDPAESLPGLEYFERLLKAGGLLISANLFLGQFAPDLPGLEMTAEYRARILDAKRWLTAYLPDGTAISIQR
jgi:predicted O-methyltransferase YrrM